MNDENLIPSNTRTKSEQREIAKMGGIASGEARRKKSLLADAVRRVANLNVTDDVRAAKMVEMGLPDDELTNAMAMAVGIIKRAIKGDTSAFNAVRDILGEKPKEEMELSTFGKLEIGMVEVQHTPAASEDEIDDI